MDWAMTPFVNTFDAVDQERHGTRTKGLGQFVAANEAIWKGGIIATSTITFGD